MVQASTRLRLLEFKDVHALGRRHDRCHEDRTEGSIEWGKENAMTRKGKKTTGQVWYIVAIGFGYLPDVGL